MLARTSGVASSAPAPDRARRLQVTVGQLVLASACLFLGCVAGRGLDHSTALARPRRSARCCAWLPFVRRPVQGGRSVCGSSRSSSRRRST